MVESTCSTNRTLVPFDCSKSTTAAQPLVNSCSGSSLSTTNQVVLAYATRSISLSAKLFPFSGNSSLNLISGLDILQVGVAYNGRFRTILQGIYECLITIFQINYQRFKITKLRKFTQVSNHKISMRYQ